MIAETNEYVSNEKERLFKEIIKHIKDKIISDGNQFTIATSRHPSTRTKAEYYKDEGMWKVCINLSEARMDKDCALWDLLHEYGHTKNVALRKDAPLEERMPHEEKAWKDGWNEAVKRFLSIENYKPGFDKWRENCLDDWRKSFVTK